MAGSAPPAPTADVHHICRRPGSPIPSRGLAACGHGSWEHPHSLHPNPAVLEPASSKHLLTKLSSINSNLYTNTDLSATHRPKPTPLWSARHCALDQNSQVPRASSTATAQLLLSPTLGAGEAHDVKGKACSEAQRCTLHSATLVERRISHLPPRPRP